MLQFYCSSLSILILHEVITNNGYKFFGHYGGLFSALFDTSGASL